MSRCGFEGNPDIYSLGVRLGAYLSWISITIASTFFPSARKDLLDALVIFSISFFAAIILESLNDETYTVELIIMGYIFFGGIVTTSISLGQDVTLGDLPGASNLDSNSAVGQEIGSSRSSSANGGSTHPENGIVTEALPVVTSRTPVYRANPSLWRGVVLVLCVVGMEAHTFWLYWFADPFRETPCGTWIFPWATLHDNSLRHGPIMVFGLLSFVTFPMVLTALLGIVLFGPDFLAILQAVALRKRAKSVEERGFQSYNKRIYFLAQRLRWLSRDIKKSWPRTYAIFNIYSTKAPMLDTDTFRQGATATSYRSKRSNLCIHRVRHRAHDPRKWNPWSKHIVCSWAAHTIPYRRFDVGKAYIYRLLRRL